MIRVNSPDEKQMCVMDFLIRHWQDLREQVDANDFRKDSRKTRRAWLKLMLMHHLIRMREKDTR